jgi:mannose/fructose/N-acetylgalactosamine-specific phosphotransferase system component IID
MTEVTASLETLFEKARDYSKTSIELFKLNTIAKVADVGSAIIFRVLATLFVALALMMTSIGIALWLGQLLGNAYYGFFVMGILYVFITLALYLFRDKWIKNPISHAIIEKLQSETAI